MDVFYKFIPNCTSLEPAAIIDQKLCSLPFPEVMSSQEIIEVGKICSESTATLWSYGYGTAPKKFERLPINKIAELSFSESYNNILIALESFEAYIWQPDSHEYFVIFGLVKNITKIVSGNILTYSFSEYVNEKYFQNKRAGAMKEIQKKYTISLNEVDRH